MSFWLLCWRNLTQRRVRTGLTVFSIAAAVAVLYTLLSFNRGYTVSLKRQLQQMGVHALVVPPGCPFEAASLLLKGGTPPAYLTEEVAERVAATKGVEIGAPGFLSAAVHDGRTDIYYGMDARTVRLKNWWKLKPGGRWFADGERDGVVLGSDAAVTELVIKQQTDPFTPGMEVWVPELGRALRVLGVLEPTGTQDDGFFYVPLAVAQQVFGKPGKVTVVALRFADPTEAGSVTEELQRIEGTEVITMTELLGTQQRMMESARLLVLAIVVLAVAIAGLGVLNTVLLSVLERTREIGVMRATGAGKGHVFFVVWMETMLMTAAGGVLGLVIALGSSRLLESAVVGALARVRFLAVGAHARLAVFEPRIVVMTLLFVLLIGLAAGVYPALRASRQQPIEALRTELATMGDHLRLALKNLLRRRSRTLLTLLGVGVAVSILYSLLAFQRGYERGLRAEMDALGAHILVVPRGCPYEAATIVLHGGKWPRYMDQDYADRIASTPGVRQAAPVLMDAIIDPEGRDSSIFVGITERYGDLRPRWSIAGRDLGGGGAREVLLGSAVASKLRLSAGDTFRLRQSPSGRAAGKQDADLRVVGVLERSGNQDDGFIFMPLRTLQELFGLPGKIVVVLVRAERIDAASLERTTQNLRALGGNMNVFPLSELLENASQLMQVTRVFVLAIVVVALAVGAAGVLNTILMTVFERTREIGMMKAIGAAPRDIFLLIWAETVLLCAAGGVAGVGLAIGASRAVEWFLRRAIASQFSALPETTLIGVSPAVALGCVALAMVLGVLAGLYPAWRAASVRPVEAIRGA